MSITIRFVGGPADGQTFATTAVVPPPLYLIPMAPPLNELFSQSLEPSPIQKAEYEPTYQGGWPSRADDGAYLYRHRPAPVSPEARRALEASRREAQAAEERRAAELAEVWQDIRRERPHLPPDWRELFS